MTQFNFPVLVPSVHTGTDLCNFLNSWRPALLSTHRGAARPPYSVQGNLWVDSSTANTDVLTYFDGTHDVPLLSIDTTTGTATNADTTRIFHGNSEVVIPTANTDIVMRTNGVERLRIDVDGVAYTGGTIPLSSARAGDIVMGPTQNQRIWFQDEASVRVGNDPTLVGFVGSTNMIRLTTYSKVGDIRSLMINAAADFNAYETEPYLVTATGYPSQKPVMIYSSLWDNSTLVDPTPLDALVIGMRTANQNIWSISAGGMVYQLGGLATGGATVTEAAPGGVTSLTTGGSLLLPGLVLKDTVVNHGYTSLLQANSYLTVSQSASASGGARFTAASMLDRALAFVAAVTTEGVLGGIRAPIMMQAGLISGGGLTALADTSTLFKLFNHGTLLEEVKGNGDRIIAGGVAIGNATVATGAYSAKERSTDPADPAEGEYVMWMSDGTATGNDGDILIKRTANSVTDVITLGGSGGLQAVVDDPSPQLGGDLDSQGHNISAVNNLNFTGRIISGNDPAPTSIVNGLNLYTSAAGSIACFKLSTVSHPFTSFTSAQCYGDVRPVGSQGCVTLRGFSTWKSAAMIAGYASAPVTGREFGVIHLIGYKNSGSGAASLASNENLLAISNNGTIVGNVKGNGDAILYGKVVDYTPERLIITSANQTSTLDHESEIVAIEEGTTGITYTVNNAIHAVGAKIHVMQADVGQITFAASTGTMSCASSFNLKTREQYAIVTLWKRTATQWVAYGALEVA